MDDKIKTILKANHLFDENNNRESFDVSFNRLDEFYDTYKQNHTNKQSIPEVKRDKNGRIILEEIPFIVSNLEKENINWLLLNNGTKLLLKKNRDTNENDFEVLISYFLKQLDIKHAKYDVATFNGKEYLVTPSFLRNKEKVNLPFDECPNIIEGYNKMKKGGTFILVREEKYGFFPFLSNQITSCQDIFSYLLEYEEIMNFTNKQLRKSNIYKALCEIEKEKNIIMNNDCYNEIQNFFKDSEYLINSVLKDKGKAFSIKLT